MFFDLALVYDPDGRCCDLAIGADGDLVVDVTSITPVLISIGLDRRAALDDPLPAGRTVFLAPASFSERRGWPGDALDPAGERIGSRLWLLDRAKANDTTLQLFTMWLEEALAWAEPETGEPPEIEVQWAARQTLTYRVLVADDGVELRRAA